MLSAAAGVAAIAAVALTVAAAREIVDAAHAPASVVQIPLASTSKNASVPILNFGDVDYVGLITVGTPAKTFRVQFDTGSSDLWVFDLRGNEKRCARDAQVHSCYNASASSSSFNTGYDAQVSYASGLTASLTVFQDTVSVGGMAGTGVEFGAATSESLKWWEYPQDGILGLGFDGLCRVGKRPVWPVIAGQIGMDTTFSFFLSRLPEGPNDDGEVGGSQLTLGGWDSSLALPGAELLWVPVSPPVRNHFGYWEVQLYHLVVDTYGGGRFDACDGRQGCTAVVDSGTSLLNADADTFQRIADDFTAAASGTCESRGLVSCPSAGLAWSRLSNLTIVLEVVDSSFGDKQLVDFTVTPQDYLDCQAGMCTLMVGSSGPGATQMILGNTFMRQFVTVFDMNEHRVGFAAASATSVPTKSNYSFPKPSFFSSSWFWGTVIAVLVVGLCVGGYFCQRRGCCSVEEDDDDGDSHDEGAYMDLSQAHVTLPGGGAAEVTLADMSRADQGESSDSDTAGGNARDRMSTLGGYSHSGDPIDGNL